MTVRALLVLALLTVVTGCGSASVSQPPAGVDGLTIPTPSPDPADFRDGPSNRWWFDGGAGTRWTYDVSDSDGTHRLRIQACAGADVDGVPTEGLCTSEAGHRTVDYYAQDDSGNTWWFGREGVWTAGADGQEPGLAMAATPRVGDGYVLGDGDVATVESVDDRVTVPAGSYRDVVRIEVRSSDGLVSERSYAPGVGLVLQTEGGRTERLLRVRGAAVS